ncbi:methylated-DNA--[protein]-cysteine S-methyltransferase [Alkalibacillus aidingensis]|uniref:methylated-DNA--[protein]-cysteine S-methyltransferase n=1 Tax=Alkalibacillus aidingensis TaxID=2747607 RepID=UPI00166086AB|nr:methylated-DNA--[protein]-cysteine S-methyltransferase [Alkalibacillus aidingensis]
MKLLTMTYPSPVGPLFLGSDGENLYWIDFGTAEEKMNKIQNWLKKHRIDPHFKEDPSSFEPVISQLEEYFSGDRKTFDVDFKFVGTEFQKQVWQALTQIPYGETVAYGDIAKTINKPKAVRAVGGALNKNPFSIIVPCHRVIGKNGSLTGFGGGLDKKTWLLEHELKYYD